jgi:hypothetical protein
MIALPAIAFLLFFLVLHKKGVEGRRAFLAAATFCGSSVVLSTEFLSVFRLVTRGGVAICWLAICVACLIVYWELGRSAIGAPSAPQSDVDFAVDDLDRTTKILLSGAGIIVVLVGITALVAPPTGIDAMAYHMPRVAMWINNHNVGFYPTRDYTQLIYGAFAEYSIMHTILLWGNDRFTNMVQFFSFVGCAVAVSYIVKLLGGNQRSQALAAVISITIPEGILEASGPKNMYSASFWIATLAAFLLASNQEISWLDTICIGLAAGLAIFTKGTAYIILPFIVLTCWWASPGRARIRFLKRCVVVVALILAINTPQYLRNYQFDGSPLGTSPKLNYGELQLTIQGIGIKSTLANLLRNISLQMGTPIESVNLRIEHGFRKAIELVGANPDDPRQVVFAEPFSVNHLSFNEFLAGNPLHLLLLLIALGIIFSKFKFAEDRMLVWYSLGILSAFVAFCAILKWQMWSSRFHLPFFVLGAAIIALTLVRYFPRRILTAIAIVLLAWGMLNASINRFRSLVPVARWKSAYGPRPLMYFAHNLDHLAPSYIASAQIINKTGCTSVGIDSYTPLTDPEIIRSPDSFLTYPILALMHADGRTRMAWFSGVHNLTAGYAAQQPHPTACAIICLDCAKVPAKWEEYGSFANHYVFENAVVFTNVPTSSLKVKQR